MMKRCITMLAVLLCSLLTTFAQVKAPTDISTLDNAIYVESAIVAPGSQQVLSVRMKNAVPVAGFEFNLLLPERMTIATDEDGFPLAELSTKRTTANRTSYFDSSLQTDGSLKVLCGTARKDPSTGLPYAFSGNDGEVARITVDVAANISVGQHTVVVKDAIIAAPDAVKTTIATDVESILEVKADKTGDANGDGSVTIADVAAVVSYLMHQPTEDFEFSNADVDGGGEVTIDDALAIVHIILEHNGNNN